MSDIFLSYAREDRDKAEHLAQALSGCGWSVWWDPRIPTGANYRHAIDEALAAARCVVVLWSRHAVESDWVLEEAEDGKSRGVLVPVLIDDVELPRGFRLIQAARVPDVSSARSSVALRGLIDDIARVVGRPPLAQTTGPDALVHAGRSEEPEGEPRPEQPTALVRRPIGSTEEAETVAPLPKRRPRPVRWPRVAAILGPLLVMMGVVVLGIVLHGQRRQGHDTSPTVVSPEPVGVPSPTGPARAAAMRSIPAGPFWMGCNEEIDQQCDPSEKPGRLVEVAAFLIDRSEVTVAQYRECVAARACSLPDTAEQCTWAQSSHDDDPINCVDWSQATQYCEWAGKRLPTEQEWEKAARGADGRKYPWGNVWGKKQANVDSDGPKPVGSYRTDTSPYGVVDMAGNLSEWIRIGEGDPKLTKGDSWRSDQPERYARASSHGAAAEDYQSNAQGFRCLR